MTQAHFKQAVAQLHRRYRAYRNDNVPFPIESIIAWYSLFAAQANLDVRGDILEMGVEHGGTAFLEAVALRDDENLELVDLKQSPRFKAMADTLPESLSKRIHFHECSTRARELDALTDRRFRFIHIDAGHSKSDVVHDIRRFSGALSPEGILCCDDVFEIRWPGVTEAVLQEMPATDLVPFLFVNRKLYFCYASMSEKYRQTLTDALPDIKGFGDLRHWTETMLEADTLIWKQIPRSANLGDLIH